MASRLGQLVTGIWLAATEAVRDPAELLRRLERGDADSSGSTLRTLGIVILVVLVVGVIGTAVYAAAGVIAGKINSASFTFGQ